MSIQTIVYDIVRGRLSEHTRARAQKWVEQLDAYIADGYEGTEGDIAVADLIAEYLNEGGVPMP